MIAELEDEGGEEYQNYINDYLKEIEENPDAFSSFEDYLGANAMQMCEGCDKIVEYDEVDENGYCFDCQGNEEDEEDEY